MIRLIFIIIIALSAPAALAAEVKFSPSVSIPGSVFQRGQEILVTGATKTICDYIIAYYQYGIGILAVVAVVVIAISGLIWVTSFGNAGKIARAKSKIFDAILGLAVALFSFVILSTINKELVVCKNLQLPTAKKLEAELQGIEKYSDNQANFINNIDTYDALLKIISDQYAIDCTLLKAHMIAESGGIATATNSAGAKGLMQVLPGTARQMNCGPDLFDPQTAIECGARYIKFLEQNCCAGQPRNNVCTNQDVKYRIAAYNAGPNGNLPSKNCPGLPAWECKIKAGGYVETQKYVEKVKANFNKLKKNGWGC